MLDALNITEEEALGLAELAQHDLAMARDFARRAQAAEDADEANRYARSYQRAARSYRQTLALKARLKRDLAQADAAAAAAEDAPRGRPGRAAIARRMQELRTALTRLAWDEAERPETEQDDAAPDGVVGRAGEPDYETFAGIRDEIDGLVTAECLRDSFCDAPLDDHVARVGSYLGFFPEAIARWRDLSDPPPAAFDHEPDLAWRSSA